MAGATGRTWRALDHTPVAGPEAAREWALQAHDILEELAPRYGRSIALDDLAHEVQRRTEIHTDVATAVWMTAVLHAVEERCQEAGEPRLTSLVDRYADGSTMTAERLRCHEAYGAKIPTETPRKRTTRSASSSARGQGAPRAKARSTEPRRMPVCPSCFLEMPASGVCDNCS